MSGSKRKATVTTIHLLDGEPINMQDEVIKPTTCERVVYTRRNGSHYIVTLGSREDVFLQEDGTFIEYMIGHRVKPVSLGGVIRGMTV